MNRGLYFTAFLMGAAVGSGVTWYFLKTKYERIAQEEIDSVKEVFGRQSKSEKDEPAEPETEARQTADEAREKPNILEYAKKLKDVGYVNYASGGEEKNKLKPYVIPPEEYGVIDEYQKISLTYYSDGVLADDNDEIVDDVADTVGEDFADHFGEYEEDSVFIRNDDRSCDFEILRDNRTYEEVSGTKPNQVEIK